MSTLPRSFFDRSVLEVAPELLGCVVVRGDVRVRLTEVEAYAGSSDPGSHAFRGRTPRTEVMFGPPGHLYVYFTYGIHWCVNVVCGPVGYASGVLLRAGEVVGGETSAARRRDGATHRDLARGPACLARALDIEGSFDGADLCAADAAVRIEAPATPVDSSRIRSGPRVGVSGPGGDGAAYPWRHWIADDRSVSAYRAAVKRGSR